MLCSSKHQQASIHHHHHHPQLVCQAHSKCQISSWKSRRSLMAMGRNWQTRCSMYINSVKWQESRNQRNYLRELWCSQWQRYSLGGIQSLPKVGHNSRFVCGRIVVHNCKPHLGTYTMPCITKKRYLTCISWRPWLSKMSTSGQSCSKFVIWCQCRNYFWHICMFWSVMCSSMSCLVICPMSVLLCNLLTVLTVQYGFQARGSIHCNMFPSNCSTSSNMGMVLMGKMMGTPPWNLVLQ